MHTLTIGRCLVFFSVTIISILFLTIRANNRHEYTLLWRGENEMLEEAKAAFCFNHLSYVVPACLGTCPC
mgnify:FL=1